MSWRFLCLMITSVVQATVLARQGFTGEEVVVEVDVGMQPSTVELVQ